jgi:hypothetical protein
VVHRQEKQLDRRKNSFTCCPASSPFSRAMATSTMMSWGFRCHGRSHQGTAVADRGHNFIFGLQKLLACRGNQRVVVSNLEASVEAAKARFADEKVSSQCKLLAETSCNNESGREPPVNERTK